MASALPPLSARVGPTPAPVLPEGPDGIAWRSATVRDVDAIIALHAAADPLDHPSFGWTRDEIEEDFEAPWVDPRRDTIVATQDERVVAHGSAVLLPGRETIARALIMGRVHPEHRSRGIGTRLLRWQEARAREQLGSLDESVQGWILDYVDESHPAASRLLDREGFRVERHFAELGRSVHGDLPEYPAPEGVDLVGWRVAQVEDVRLVRNAVFADHWGSQPRTVDEWRMLVEAPRFRPEHSVLAVAKGEVVGFLLTTVNEADWSRLGERAGYVEMLGVRRDHRGRGVARALLARALRSYASAGWDRATLDVDAASPTGAVALYESMGFRPVSRARAYVKSF